MSSYSTPALGATFDPAEVQSLFDDFETAINDLDANNFAKSTNISFREIHPGALVKEHVSEGEGAAVMLATVPGTTTASPFPDHGGDFDIPDTGISFFADEVTNCEWESVVSVEKVRTDGLWDDATAPGTVTLNAVLSVYLNGTVINTPNLTVSNNYIELTVPDHAGFTLQAQGVATLVEGLNTFHATLSLSGTTTGNTPTGKDDYFVQFLVLGRLNRVTVVRR